MFGQQKEQPKLDYQSQNRKVVNLEVPPDLTNPGQNSLYQLPAGSGAVRASDINRNRAINQHAGGQTVLAGVSGVKMERDGSQRWLTVSGKKPAELWPLLKTFWQESGFTIASEEPAIGQMETDWAENRAKLSGGGLRSLLEKSAWAAFTPPASATNSSSASNKPKRRHRHLLRPQRHERNLYRPQRRTHHVAAAPERSEPGSRLFSTLHAIPGRGRKTNPVRTRRHCRRQTGFQPGQIGKRQPAALWRLLA